MGEYRLGEIEMKFAEIIWNMEPVQSGALAKEAEKELGWKKSTTYTVLKRLCERGIFQNDRGTVTSCLTRREFQARQSEDFVEETFDGSLPNFVAAFVSRKKLSEEEIMELKKIIEEN
ncbi:MAG: BlaI/MecI/CopY family transcriptional regulator [Agathobacter sp.]|nr:BlaI/MecI/CopY family transcriptional regulator [Agathobacter sp.]